MKQIHTLFMALIALAFLNHCSGGGGEDPLPDLTVLCVDADGDGYTVDAGDVTTGLVACTTESDCDDSNSGIHPHSIDVLDDSVDSDCSGGDGLAADDADADGIDDLSDNCPNYNNASQTDTDADGHGDACDLWPTDSSRWEDTDSDGIDDNLDLCPEVIDADLQTDTDGDGYGVSCDANDTDASFSVDADSDGYDDLLNDNCPTVANADQYDTDHDGEGNACDTDDDDDLTLDDQDLCPLTAGHEDYNGNGIGDVCENDADGDGVGDAVDDNPSSYDPGQDADTDGTDYSGAGTEIVPSHHEFIIRTISLPI